MESRAMFLNLSHVKMCRCQLPELQLMGVEDNTLKIKNPDKDLRIAEMSESVL